MFKKLNKSLRMIEAFEKDAVDLVTRLNAAEAVLEAHQNALNDITSDHEALDSSVRREVLNMAELYGKTYRLLKRMQAEDRADTPEPDITPEPVETDRVTARVLARRNHGVSESGTKR